VAYGDVGVAPPRCQEAIWLTFEGGKAPWPDNEGTKALLSAYRVAGVRLGMRVVAERRGGLSDGNLLWSHAPTIDGLGLHKKR
jgi:hypothetical protein